MKRKILLRIILFSLALLVIPLLYITSYTQQNQDPDNTFLVGVQAMGYNSIDNNPNDFYLWSEQMPYIKDSLGMNFISLFANDSIRPPCDGGLYDNINLYSGYVNYFMGYIKDQEETGIYERLTYRKLCGAQRSTYQVEDHGFYGYTDEGTIGSDFQNDEYGVSGRKALLSQNGPGGEGYLVKGLIENCEQSDNWKYGGAGAIDDSTWYVKPRMRIPADVAINYPDMLVAKVEIWSFDSTQIKSVDIKAGYFLDENLNYDGSYEEEFNFPPLSNINLTIAGNTDSLNHGAHTTFNGEAYGIPDCKVDYRIYWYGNCNLWVDYVRLDDQWAHGLLSSDPSRVFYEKIIKMSDDVIGDNVLYITGVRRNNLPAINYVKNVLESAHSKLHIVAIPYNIKEIASQYIHDKIATCK